MGRMTREEYMAYCQAKIAESRRLVQEFYEAHASVGGDIRLLEIEVPKVPYDESNVTFIGAWGGSDFRARVPFLLPDGTPFQQMAPNRMEPDYVSIVKGHDPSGRELQEWHRFMRRGIIQTAPCWNRFEDRRTEDDKPYVVNVDSPPDADLELVKNADWNVIQLNRDPFMYWPKIWQECLPAGYKWTGPSEFHPWLPRAYG
jgi:hypothetical protein